MSKQKKEAEQFFKDAHLDEKFVWHKKITKLKKQGYTKQQIDELDKKQHEEDKKVFIFLYY